MRLDIESGSKAADYNDIAKSEHLSSKILLEKQKIYIYI